MFQWYAACISVPNTINTYTVHFSCYVTVCIYSYITIHMYVLTKFSTATTILDKIPHISWYMLFDGYFMMITAECQLR